MKKLLKIVKVLGILLAVAVVLLLLVYHFVLQYPKLGDDPRPGKWYRVTSREMRASDGSSYRAYFKKGSENKVLLYFAGGGVSVSEEMARGNFYNKTETGNDILMNAVLNMGGLATASDANPFRDWSVVLFPYATGDFHVGTGEFSYRDADGKEKTLYHYGYTNFRAVMQEVMEYSGIGDPEAVVVTGYSAGGFGAALLADEVFGKYFPTAKSKTVLVDAALLLHEDWHRIAADVWQAPREISDRLTTDNITLDSLRALHQKYGDEIHILFDSSTRDGDLAKLQNYFDTGVFEVDEEAADRYQQTLKETLPKFREQAGAYVYIWDGLPWNDDPGNLTMHTIISTPYCLEKFGNGEPSIAEWLMNAVNGKPENHG